MFLRTGAKSRHRRVMIPEEKLDDHSVLIVTGASLRAEEQDRPLAYRLQAVCEERLRDGLGVEPRVVVLSDLWYLNSEELQKLPTISVGGPGVNALSAHLFRRLPNALIVDDRLLIQMDLELQELRAVLWGANHGLTEDALELFVGRTYLDRFLAAVATKARL